MAPPAAYKALHSTSFIPACTDRAGRTKENASNLFEAFSLAKALTFKKKEEGQGLSNSKDNSLKVKRCLDNRARFVRLVDKQRGNMKRNTKQTYIAIGKKLNTKTYARIAKVGNVSRQTVSQSLNNGQAYVELQDALREKLIEEDACFMVRAKAIDFNTKLHQPREIAELVGMPGFPRAEELLKAAGIAFEPTRPGGRSSAFAKFALTLPRTDTLTAREIATLGNFTDHTSPGLTLKRHGIPYRELRPGLYERTPKTQTLRSL